MANRRPRRWLRRSILTLVTIYVLICVLMVVAQGWLLFHPTTLPQAKAEAITAADDVEPLRIEVDGAVLQGVLVKASGPAPRPTVIYFGGNAESVWYREKDQRWLVEHGWNLALVPYRGYDGSTGSPDADDLLADALAIHDALVQRPDVDAEHVVAWGVSLGTGVASYMAEQRPLAGVILSAPYARLSDIAADLYPWLPVRWLFRHEIDTEGRAAAITEPVLLLHGEADTLIPIEHSRRLARAWGGPSQLVALPQTGHNGLYKHSTVREQVQAFLGEHGPAPHQPPALGDDTPKDEPTPAATSVVPSGPPPVQVAARLAEVSAARLRADIDALAGFETRHTLSADAPDRGIVAARRYLEEQLKAAIAPREGPPLAVEVESFAVTPDGRRIDRAATLHNVIATLPGTMPQATARRIYVMGHYDSRATDVMDPEVPAPGANDDASGVALTVELARVLAGQPLDATVVFMATAGEEQGLLGARHHAEAIRAQDVVVTGVLNHDIVGDPSGPGGQRHDRHVRVFSSGVPLSLSGEQLARRRATGSLSDGPSRQLARYVATVAAWENTTVQPTLVFRPDRFLRGGDHLAFDEQGYPAVRMTEVAEDYDRQHQDPRTEGDRRFGDFPEHVDERYLAAVTRLSGAVLIHLANAPAAPEGAAVVATALTTDTTVRWSPSPEPDVAGYEVVWRATESPAWQHVRDAGPKAEITLPLHKDDWIFGVRAYDRDGYRSPVAACGIVRR